jgi:hypothetical protein
MRSAGEAVAVAVMPPEVTAALPTVTVTEGDGVVEGDGTVVVTAV